jgi:hypothetical protein
MRVVLFFIYRTAFPIEPTLSFENIRCFSFPLENIRCFSCVKWLYIDIF